MKKLLLVNPPAKQKVIRDYYCGHSVKGDYFWVPIDLVMLSRLDDYEIKIIDFMIEDVAIGEQAATDFNPDIIIGMVWEKILNDDLSYLRNLKIKTGADELYFIGDASKFHSNKLKNLNDGEHILESFFHLENSGLGKFSLPKHHLLNLQKYSMPYSLYHGVLTVLTAYACPFKCSFCNSGSYAYVERPIVEIVEELRQIKKMGVKEIYFRDFTFTANEPRVRELCAEMIKNDFNFVWSCDARANVSRDTLSAMARAGCYLAFFGVESAHDKTLLAVHKSITRQMLERVFSDCHSLGIKVLASFIIGLPDETEKEIWQTLDFAKQFCDYASFNTFEGRIGADLQIKKGSEEFTKKIEKFFYMRPQYIIKQFFSIRTFFQFKNLILNGLSIFKK